MRGGRGLARSWGRAAVVALVALVSAGSAMTVWGSHAHDIGPLETRLSLVPSLTGGLRVHVPPLGRLEMPTHRGPLQVSATVTAVDPRRARALLVSRSPGRTVSRQVAADSRDALAEVAARGVLVALLSSAVTCAVVFRRPGAVLGGTAAVAVVLTASTGVAAATLRTEALNEPTFDGLLAQAPALIGRVQDFDAYSQRVAELTANVARVYGNLAELPATPAAQDTTRLLWVSDIHNNPQSFTVMSQLVEQFDVAAVLDTGDIVDVGSAVENRLLTRIGGLGVPYLYVRGNHDSRAVTQAFIAAQPGARVLEAGDVVDVLGVRIAGIGHPLFRPNKASASDAKDNDLVLEAAGEQLLAALAADPEPVDVVMVHEAAMSEALLGEVPLVLTGHAHERRHRVERGTLRLTQGSSGGAGLRALDEGAPLPLQMSVLHFDGRGALLAADDIDVGGLGQRSVTVERRSSDFYRQPPAEAAPPGGQDVEGEAVGPSS
jgi:predicted phosphodiesterase